MTKSPGDAIIYKTRVQFAAALGQMLPLLPTAEQCDGAGYPPAAAATHLRRQLAGPELRPLVESITGTPLRLDAEPQITGLGLI